ncbi:DUF2795 domain-containing protein [Streptodolium elevatio]|uniref:DUF2795 domain-containing protein n=1 Tax=Streptodolium elevatio TaxID=3157996 RepID=A0ABV3DVM3_9ACTN
MSTALPAPTAPTPLRRPVAPQPPTREAVCRALVDVTWPARKADLVRAATPRRARTDIVRLLETLPDAPYLGPNQVCRTLFGPHGHTQPSP